MKDYNKKNLIFLSLFGLLGLTIFSTVVMLTGGGWLSYILPLLAEGYGLYVFFKKYHPNN